VRNRPHSIPRQEHDSAPGSPGPGTDWDVGAETLRRVSRMSRFNNWLVDELEPHMGQVVLEVGAGTGNITQWLLRRGKRVVALDRSAASLEFLGGRFGGHANLECLLADITDTDGEELRRCGADTVICLNVLEHVEADALALHCMREALLPGGRLLLLVPAHPWLYGSLDRALGHLRRYRRRTLCELVTGAGFRVMRSRYFNLFGVLGWWVASRLTCQQVLPERSLALYERLTPLFRLLERLTGRLLGQSLIVVAEATNNPRSGEEA